MPFSVAKISHSLNTALEGTAYHRLDRRRVLAELDLSGAKSCPKTNDTSEETVYDQSVEAYLALFGQRKQF